MNKPAKPYKILKFSSFFRPLPPLTIIFADVNSGLSLFDTSLERNFGKFLFFKSIFNIFISTFSFLLMEAKFII
jgi:hypothetical protein